MRGSKAAVGVALLASTACVGPARTHNDFQLKAKSTAETTLSAVGTTQLVVRLAADDRGPDEPERRVRRQYRVEQAG
jgi:hypothetical protein